MDLIKQIMNMDGDTISSEEFSELFKTRLETDRVAEDLDDNRNCAKSSSFNSEITEHVKESNQSIFGCEDSISYAVGEPCPGNPELSDYGKQFIKRSMENGYSKEDSLVYLSVLNSKLTYGEFLKNHNEIYEKQQRRMLANRIIGHKKARHCKQSYFYNSIKIMTKQYTFISSCDYDVKSHELADKYISGFSGSFNSIGRVGRILKFLNDELLDMAKDCPTWVRRVNQWEITRLLTFALFRPNTLEERKGMFYTPLENYINRDLLDALRIQFEGTDEIMSILDSIEEVCVECSEEMFAYLADKDSKVKYDLKRLYDLMFKLERTTHLPEELISKVLSKGLKRYYKITGKELDEYTTVDSLSSVIQDDIYCIRKQLQ